MAHASRIAEGGIKSIARFRSDKFDHSFDDSKSITTPRE
jgi:hypothetical protein